MCPVSRHGGQHLSGEGLSVGLLHESVSGLYDQFPFASISSSGDVAATVGPHGVVGMVSFPGSLSDAPSSVAPQGSLVTNVGRSFSCSSSVSGVHEVGLLVAPEEEARCRHSSAGYPCLSSSAYGCLSVDLTASRVWSCEERLLYINVLEICAVVLALAAFLPQLARQVVVLTSDNTTVVAYLTLSAP